MARRGSGSLSSSYEFYHLLFQRFKRGYVQSPRTEFIGPGVLVLFICIYSPDCSYFKVYVYCVFW